MSASSGLMLMTDRFWHIQPLTAPLFGTGWVTPAVWFSLTFLLDCKVPLWVCVSPDGRDGFNFIGASLCFMSLHAVQTQGEPQDQHLDKPGCRRTPLHRCPLSSAIFTVKSGLKTLLQQLISLNTKSLVNQMNLLLERDHECYCYLIEDLLNCHCWTSVVCSLSSI